MEALFQENLTKAEMVERSNAMKHETVKKEKNVKGEMEHRKNMEDVGLEDI